MGPATNLRDLHEPRDFYRSHYYTLTPAFGPHAGVGLAASRRVDDIVYFSRKNAYRKSACSRNSRLVARHP